MFDASARDLQRQSRDREWRRLFRKDSVAQFASKTCPFDLGFVPVAGQRVIGLSEQLRSKKVHVRVTNPPVIRAFEVIGLG